MKKILCLLSMFVILFQVTAYADSLDPTVKFAVRKYRHGNYTGCMQDLENYVRYKRNVYAYYYLALSYSKCGKYDESKKYLNKVLSMNPKGVMKTYATQGVECLNNRDACMAGKLNFSTNSVVVQQDDLDKFINNGQKSFSKDVNRDFEQKHLDVLKYEMNSGKDLDGYTFQKYRDYSQNRSQIDNNEDPVLQARNVQYQQALTLLNSESDSSSQNEVVMNRDELSSLQANIEASRLRKLSEANSNAVQKDFSYEMPPFAAPQNMNNINPQDMSQYTPAMMQSLLMNYYMNK